MEITAEEILAHQCNLTHKIYNLKCPLCKRDLFYFKEGFLKEDTKYYRVKCDCRCYAINYKTILLSNLPEYEKYVTYIHSEELAFAENNLAFNIVKRYGFIPNEVYQVSIYDNVKSSVYTLSIDPFDFSKFDRGAYVRRIKTLYTFQ